MAFTSTIEVSITVLPTGVFEVRRVKKVSEDGDLIGEKVFRYVLEPGADVTNEPTRIQRMAQAVWTAQVIADWQAIKNANRPQ